MRRRRNLLLLLVSISSAIVLAMLLGWRFGPMREVGCHRLVQVEVKGRVVDAETGSPVPDAWVSDVPMRLPPGDRDEAAYLKRLIAHAGRPQGSIPSVIGTAPDCTERDGSFVLGTMAFWDHLEPAYGIRLGPAPKPDPFYVVRTVVVEAAGYEPRAVSVERCSWTELPSDSYLFHLNVGRIEIHARK